MAIFLFLFRNIPNIKWIQTGVAIFEILNQGLLNNTKRYLIPWYLRFRKRAAKGISRQNGFLISEYR